MAGELDRADWYLSKAAELRALAEDYSNNRETREALLFIAYGYERLAENMKIIHVSLPSAPQSPIDSSGVDAEHPESEKDPQRPGGQSEA